MKFYSVSIGEWEDVRTVMLQSENDEAKEVFEARVRQIVKDVAPSVHNEDSYLSEYALLDAVVKALNTQGFAHMSFVSTDINEAYTEARAALMRQEDEPKYSREQMLEMVRDISEEDKALLRSALDLTR